MNVGVVNVGCASESISVTDHVNSSRLFGCQYVVTELPRMAIYLEYVKHDAIASGQTSNIT